MPLIITESAHLAVLLSHYKKQCIVELEFSEVWFHKYLSYTLQYIYCTTVQNTVIPAEAYWGYMYFDAHINSYYNRTKMMHHFSWIHKLHFPMYLLPDHPHFDTEYHSHCYIDPANLSFSQMLYKTECFYAVGFLLDILDILSVPFFSSLLYHVLFFQKRRK